jgi:hypothetical protein
MNGRPTVDILFRETGERMANVPIYRDYGDGVEVELDGQIVNADRGDVPDRYTRAVIVERG